MTSVGSVRIPVCRLYVDEVGHAAIKSSNDENERYLSLLGVACNLEYVRHTLTPEMENLKRFFQRPPVILQWSDSDEPVSMPKPIIFHRKELADKKYPFEALKQPDVQQAFDSELLMCLQNWEYTVFSVVIDKARLREHFSNPAHPYHYAMETLLERYVHWLRQENCIGDVMAEARGGKEDRQLKQHYHSLHQNGTGFVSASELAANLSSRELKLKQKGENVAGLQLAEFLIRPCYYAALARKEGRPLPTNFGGKIEAIVEGSNYYRHSENGIQGYGCKWLP